MTERDATDDQELVERAVSEAFLRADPTRPPPDASLFADSCETLRSGGVLCIWSKGRPE